MALPPLTSTTTIKTNAQVLCPQPYWHDIISTYDIMTYRDCVYVLWISVAYYRNKTRLYRWHSVSEPLLKNSVWPFITVKTWGAQTSSSHNDNDWKVLLRKAVAISITFHGIRVFFPVSKRWTTEGKMLCGTHSLCSHFEIMPR